MRYLSVFLLFTAALCAETPHLSGVWKADLQKSKFGGGPPPTAYLVIIEQKTAVINEHAKVKVEAPQFVETTGTTSQRGEHRAVLTAFDYEKPVVRPYEGIPTRLTGSSSGNTFTIVGETAGTPDHWKRTYTLSEDGNTLTLAVDGMNEGHPVASSIVLNKGVEADAAPLRAPEKIASVQFKNVKVDALKNLPASEFINNMHYFSWSLGKECTFCHVERKFDADDKEEKKTARKMVDMAVAIDRDHFEDKPEVRCFTCHEGHAHPLSRPLFTDEIASAQAAAQKEHEEHEHNRPQGPPPGGGAPPPPPSN